MKALIACLAALILFAAGLIAGYRLAHVSLEKEVIELNKAFFNVK